MNWDIVIPCLIYGSVLSVFLWFAFWEEKEPIPIVALGLMWPVAALCAPFMAQYAETANGCSPRGERSLPVTQKHRGVYDQKTV